VTRLEAALAELAAAIREELRAELEVDRGPAPERLLGVPEAAEQLGIGRSRLYAELAAGRVRHVKAGRRTLIPASEVRRFAERAS